jgi:hypothetical protein
MAHLTKSDDIKGVEFAGVGRVGGGYMGVGAPSSDGLSLDLQFAADKTLTARRGPTPVFTRLSGDNGGTTYFGPLVDSNTIGGIPATGITNGRASWFKADGGIDITISYTGSRWRAVYVEFATITEYLAAPGSEWRPDQADWSGVEFSITTSSTFGIVKAANNEPRFDHDPVTLACRGLLIEESRTNLITQSGNASLWPNSNGTVTNNGSTTAPDGSSNGFLGGIGTASLITPATSSVTGLHTASVFLKRNNTDWARVQVAQGSFAHAVNFWVNLATGAAGTLAVAVGTPTSLSAQVTPFGNSWYRVSITASYPVTASLTLTVISATADNIQTRVSGSVYEVWGGQLEAGSFATSYIPTTTGTLARSADVCNITGANFTSFYNQSEGTLYADYDRSTNQGFGIKFNWMVAAIYQPGAANSHIVLMSTHVSDARMTYRNLGTDVYTINPSLLASNAIIKASFGYKSGDFAGARNGSIISTGTGVIPTVSTFDRIEFGFSNNGIYGATSGQYLNGHIAAIRYYKKRLPDAKLQALTV